MLMRYVHKNKTLLVAHNFSNQEQELTLDNKLLGGKKPKLIFSDGDISTETNESADPNASHKSEIKGYGFRWWVL